MSDREVKTSQSFEDWATESKPSQYQESREAWNAALASVTNVSREAIERAFASAETKENKPNWLLEDFPDTMRLGLDAIYELIKSRAPAPGKAATWREFMDQAPKFNQRQDSMLEQLADLRLVANKLGFYDAADYLKGPLGEPGKAADEASAAFDALSVENQLHTMGNSEVEAVHGNVAMRLREILSTLLASLKGGR